MVISYTAMAVSFLLDISASALIEIIKKEKENYDDSKLEAKEKYSEIIEFRKTLTDHFEATYTTTYKHLNPALNKEALILFKDFSFKSFFEKYIFTIDKQKKEEYEQNLTKTAITLVGEVGKELTQSLLITFNNALNANPNMSNLLNKFNQSQIYNEMKYQYATIKSSIDNLSDVSKSFSDAGNSTNRKFKTLNKLRELSKIGSNEASYITRSYIASKTIEHIHLDDYLYVNRKAQNAIIKQIYDTDATNKIIVVIGSAGTGKTSLLWKIYNEICKENDYEPLFVKSTLLKNRIPTDTDKNKGQRQAAVSNEDIQIAVSEIFIMNKFPIIILDTADTLLGNEYDRDNLLLLILTLSDSGSTIILSTRPQESNYLAGLSPEKFLLGPYDQEELTEAINKHVQRFYGRLNDFEAMKQTNKIENAVAKGLPLKEVCINPLTLRMLFTLYAPDELPYELNVFELYDTYWEMRVVKDQRSDLYYQPSDIKDLTEVTCFISMLMMAEGLFEIDEVSVRDMLFARHKNYTKYYEVDQLITRGILYRSEEATLRFFHQSFFEFCAAKALTFYSTIDFLALLKNKISREPNDLFYYPIFDYLLLLSERQSSIQRNKVESICQFLLLSDFFPLNYSGLYVYIFKRSNDERTEELAQKLLSNHNLGLLNHYITIAHNIPKKRQNRVIDHLQIIWNHGNWELRFHLLELMKRISAREPEAIIEFILNNDILTNYYTYEPNGALLLLQIIRIIIEERPKLHHHRILNILLENVEKSSNPSHKTYIFDLLGQLIDITKNTEIISICENKFQKNPTFEHDSQIIISLGNLYAHSWILSHLDFNGIISLIEQCNEHKLSIYLNGLAEYILLSPNMKSLLKSCWQFYLKEESLKMQWYWAKHFFPHVLRVDPLTINGNQQPEVLNQFLFAIIEYLIYPITKNTHNFAIDPYYHERRSQLIIIIKSVHLSKERFLQMFTHPLLRNPAYWLDKQYLSPLLGDGFVAGHSGAIDAIKTILKSSSSENEEILNMVAGRLIQEPLNNSITLKTSILLFTKIKRIKGFRSLLEINTEQIPLIITEISPDLINLRQELVISKSTINRRFGFFLWNFLLDFGLDNPPNYNFLISILNNDTDSRVKLLTVSLFGACFYFHNYELEIVFKTLFPLCSSENFGIQNAALNSLFRAISNRNYSPKEYTEKIFQIIMMTPIKLNNLSQFGFLIKLLVIHNEIELTIELIKRFFSNPVISSTSSSLKRSLLARLRKPLRFLFKHLNATQIEKILHIVSQSDPVLAKILIDAACHTAFNNSLPYLNALLNNPIIHGKIKELIRRHKHLRERTKGGTGWHHLYDFDILVRK